MKAIKYLLKNIIFSTIFIYSLNIILINLDFIIPINYFSFGLSGILGFPGTIVYVLLVIKFCG